MIQIVFHNLEASSLIRDVAMDRIESVCDRFPLLQNSNLVLTLSMENSPHHPGRDQFTVKLHCKSGPYRGVTLRKSDSNLYHALADLVHHLQETLNRRGHRRKVSDRRRERLWSWKNDHGDMAG